MPIPSWPSAPRLHTNREPCSPTAALWLTTPGLRRQLSILPGSTLVHGSRAHPLHTLKSLLLLFFPGGSVMARVAAQPRALGGSVALSGLALVLMPHLCIALEPHGGLHNTARWAQSNVEAAAPRARQPLTRLRGGGLIDKRTPTYWPIRPEDEETIPADGSVGGHYTMEEVCANGGGEWIGRLPAGPDPARVRDRREAARMRPGLCGAAAEHEIVARRQCRCAFNSVGFEAPELIDVDACAWQARRRHTAPSSG